MTFTILVSAPRLIISYPTGFVIFNILAHSNGRVIQQLLDFVRDDIGHSAFSIGVQPCGYQGKHQLGFVSHLADE